VLALPYNARLAVVQGIPVLQRFDARRGLVSPASASQNPKPSALAL